MESKKINPTQSVSEKPIRVGIIGCENLNKESIYSLGLCAAVDEIVLVGEGQVDLLAGIENLLKACPLNYPFRIVAGSFQDLDNAEIVLVAVGVDPGTLEGFSNSLASNAGRVRQVMGYLRSVNFGGIVLVMTNPVDEMTQVAQETSGFPVERVMGIGGIPPWLDTTTRNAKKETQGAVTWCSAHHSGGQLMDSCRPDCPYFENILDEFRETKVHIGDRGTVGPYSLASCTMLVCEAILRDEFAVLTVSSKPRGEYGISDVYTTCPVWSRDAASRRSLSLGSRTENVVAFWIIRGLVNGKRDWQNDSIRSCLQTETAHYTGK